MIKLDLQHHLTTTIRKTGGQIALLLLFLLLTKQSFARSIKIAIFDTAFCPASIFNIEKNIIIHNVVDLTSKSTENHCQFYSTKTKDRRFHGHRVLEVLIDQLKINTKLEIFPYIIFDNSKIQTLKYWKDASSHMNAQKIPYILLATGLALNNEQIKLLPKHSFQGFISAPKIGRGVKKNSVIWPQIKKGNSLLIGGFHQDKNMIIYDRGLLYNTNIDYFFPNKNSINQLSGTSNAVVLAYKRALTLCEEAFFINMKSVKNCLLKIRTRLNFIKNKKNHQKEYSY